MMMLLMSSLALAASAPASPAGCVLEKDSAGSRALMKAAPGSAELAAAATGAAPVLIACGAPRSGPSLDAMIADMAELTLRTDYAQYPFDKLPDPAFTPAQAEGLRRETAGWPTADAVGRCIVARDVKAAVRFVRARPASGSEGKALAAITPLIPGCVDAGASFTASRADLRNGVARALYRDVLSLIPEIWPS
ncbi:hypothetical protein [Sphingomonas sp.]|uniref:hypothetical protein n=1 Tax=Sphingomonas sp. TaxID=28214 RepID=UPI001EC61DC0|nr:hypothetical protein [Sphingomonas sp.]MBX3594515.1 hypothetical protein [Sphingomonas sp.]